MLLTDKEIKAKRKELKGCGLDPIEYIEAFNKAQLKKVVEWMETHSSPHYLLENDEPIDTGGRIIPDFNWQSLLKEVSETLE